MFHLLLGGYCSYCAAQFVTRSSERKKTVRLSGRPTEYAHHESYLVKLEVRLPAAVEGRHERGVDVGVREAEGVAELVGGRLEEVGALEGVDGPVLLRVGRRSQ